MRRGARGGRTDGGRRRRSRRFGFAALLAVGAVALAACRPGDVPTIDRPDDPVVLTGADVPTLQGVAPDRVVAFRFVYGAWVQIPVQVDERALVDFGTIKHQAPTGQTALQYTDENTWTGPDPDPTVDANDEIVFMARDAYGHARDITDANDLYQQPLTEPPGVVPGSGVEVELHDPLAPDARAWAYLFESDGSLDPAAGRAYVSYDFHLLSGDYKSTFTIGDGTDPEDSVVTSARATHHFSDRWIWDGLEVTTGDATGVDVLDRFKSGFFGSCARTTDTFAAGAGAHVAERSGPVRAIRSYLGANSGTWTERTHLVYEARQDVVTNLRVHPIPPLASWMDYSADALGMTFYDSGDGATGFTVDGTPDAVTQSGYPLWQLVTGAPGSVVVTNSVDTNITFDPSVYKLFYSDEESPTATQCTGDAHEYGASGAWIDANFPDTQPGSSNRFTTTQSFRYLAPGATPTDAAEVSSEYLAPLTTTVQPLVVP